MSHKNILFEDNLLIKTIDKDGKVFEKVSRIAGKGDDTKCHIELDVNSDIYPMSVGSLYEIAISKSLQIDGTSTPNHFSIETFQKKNSLLEKYDYVMYGKVFKYSEDNNGLVTIYISFGGLLMGITGEPSSLIGLNIDERVYLLLKKLD